MVIFYTGKLFYLDKEKSGTGCKCQPDWNVYYYKQTGQCYEQESKGPCPVGQYFAYNATSRSTECSCFKNFVYTPDRKTCIEQYTQGQCPEGQVCKSLRISHCKKYFYICFSFIIYFMFLYLYINFVVSCGATWKCSWMRLWASHERSFLACRW